MFHRWVTKGTISKVVNTFLLHVLHVRVPRVPHMPHRKKENRLVTWWRVIFEQSWAHATLVATI